MDRAVWQATIHGIAGTDMTEQLIDDDDYAHTL